MILLDTHALMWLAVDSDKLGPKAAQLADRAQFDGELLVAPISFWELAMLVRTNRLSLSTNVTSFRRGLLSRGLREAVFDGDVGILAAETEGLPGDPADRIIVATALTEGARLVTADERLLKWDGPLRRLDARR